MSDNFLSRVEEILTAMINGTEYSEVPQSRVEALLLELKDVIESGGGKGPFYPAGNIDYDDIPAPSEETLGAMYNVNDAFVTTNEFVEGAGVKYPAGTNVGVVNIGTVDDPIYKFDAYAGTYVTDDALSSSSENPVQNKVVKAALDGKASASELSALAAVVENKANSDDLSAVATSGSYSDLIGTPNIPAKTSDLQNDSGFVTNQIDDTTSGSSTTYSSNKINTELSTKDPLGEEVTYDEYRRIVNPTANKNYYVTGIPAEETWLYGFDIDNDDENPNTRVSYPADVDNALYNAAYMDFAADEFNPGNWNLTPGRHFMPKPCMLKYDGTVDYYLDSNDYAYKDDGETASDIADTSYGGNAMMEWNCIYTKRWETNGVYHFRCSNKKLNDDYECWSNYDRLDNVIPHFYTPIYFGSSDGTRLRSLSGQENSVNTTAQQEIDLATANGDDWFTEVNADYQLLCDLAVMLVKSTNIQEKYGSGRTKSTNSSAINTGTMNNKGLFWGSNDSTSGVKIFGMENVFGNIWRRIAGMMYVNGIYKLKITRGTHDDSTATDYNTTGDGYITISDSAILPTESTDGYIKSMRTLPYGRIVSETGGTASSSNFESDYNWKNNSGTRYALVGGRWSYGLKAGLFSVTLNVAPSFAAMYICAALSCKPTCRIGEDGRTLGLQEISI